ncbi:SRPBCC domain-containing protein [Emticicia sp. BO119]|uniref:SRPBCC family protein n=1 Tax=Emticicia sp. BO119 TaxID=2757768 RepID=UPI0015F0A094|nr:SRPBCC domain-containing protein [Emticicia sp. BO119]MBA4852566.1 SRPBCC domain-containing protein [Emticicia sp. BO119]
MKEFIVKRKTVLNATPAQVWDALTNPEKTRKYFFHCKVFSDWEVGSNITFVGRIFLIKKIEMKGIILEIIPGKLLKYSLDNTHSKESTSSFSVVTDTLSFEDSKTTLTITDDVGQGEGAEERYKKSQKGWTRIIKGLRDLFNSKH